MSRVKIIIIWEQFGPYHMARLRSLRAAFAEGQVVGMQIAERTSVYGWTQEEAADIVTLFKDREVERIGPRELFLALVRYLRKQGESVVFLPSFWPVRNLAMLLAARVAGAKCIMMSESHEGTARASKVNHWIKRRIASLFDAAFVGGTPHVRYATSLGFPESKVFVGYDIVDNSYFAGIAKCTKARAAEARERLQLPEKYVLSLGRFVEKKNLVTLITAFSGYKKQNPSSVHKLVFVGSGEEEGSMKAKCSELGLMVSDVSKGITVGRDQADVLFYGFRQVRENAEIYSLADVFVLPSHREEWGLVVNEAMACGVPVLVAKTVGCAEDLVREGENGYSFRPWDHEELTTKLVLVLGTPAHSRPMGERSAEIIEKWGSEKFGVEASKAIASVSK